MPLSIVVGGQYGSEGKGKVAHFLSELRDAAAVVRVGGPNSGHTVIDEHGGVRVFRHLPTAAVRPSVLCVLAPGTLLDPEVFLREVEETGLGPERVVVDPRAVLINGEDRSMEGGGRLRQAIGSTLTGTGAALVRRIQRTVGIDFADSHPLIAPFVRPTQPHLRQLLDRGARVVIEGTQGFGLSVLHSPHYPYVTSRDTTAAGFLSETGLSPLDVDEVALVIRAFPIRVAGNSGPLVGETSWEALAMAAGARSSFAEYTSVTRSLRRVGEFEPGIVRAAISVNRPTSLFLNHIDQVDYEVRGASVLSPSASAFVAFIERAVDRQVDWIGTAPDKITVRPNQTDPRLEKADMAGVG
jgi:adenylosuccinate synthase